MDITVTPKDTHNLYQTPLLHQTSFWSAVKSRQGFGPLAFDIKVRSTDITTKATPTTYFVDDVLVLLKEVGPGSTIGYIPYGPSIRPDDEFKGRFLEELSDAIRYHLAKDDGCYNQTGAWLGPPEPPLQELRINYGTMLRNLRKSYTDILPADTTLVDLDKPAEDLLSSMKPKTRYNIRLALRKRIAVRTGTRSDLDIFHSLYRETCMRNHITLHDQSYFLNLFQAGKEETDAKFELLVAELEGEPLASMFLVYSGQRATYLYGASSSDHRDSMAAYRLQWVAMEHAKKHDCIEYDMFGIAPNADPEHPMHGLYRFKTGFGGRKLHRMGCWDFPLDSVRYQLFHSKELAGRGYHI